MAVLKGEKYIAADAGAGDFGSAGVVGVSDGVAPFDEGGAGVSDVSPLESSAISSRLCCGIRKAPEQKRVQGEFAKPKDQDEQRGKEKCVRLGDVEFAGQRNAKFEKRNQNADLKIGATLSERNRRTSGRG